MKIVKASNLGALRHHRIITLFVGMAWLLPSPALADLPLTIEDLLTAQQRWRIELGAVYANSTTNGVESGQYALIQTGPTQFVPVPTVIGEQRRNSDTLVLTPGLRYGLSGDTELYNRFSVLTNTTRSQGPSGTAVQDDERFADVWLGINHRFIKEGNTPALLGFLEVAVVENIAAPPSDGSEFIHGKSWLVGFTTYRAIDPLVLAATLAWRSNLSRPDSASASGSAAQTRKRAIPAIYY